MNNAPLFQHRHFAWLAAWANKNMGNPFEIQRLADDLAATNPGFDRERFLDAAGARPSNWRDEPRNNEMPASVNMNEGRRRA